MHTLTNTGKSTVANRDEKKKSKRKKRQPNPAGDQRPFKCGKGRPSPVGGWEKTIDTNLIDLLEEQKSFDSIRAVGHRVVHGMKHTAPELVTQELLDELIPAVSSKS